MLVTVTGVSGSGKTTLIRHLNKTFPNLFREAVSVTTRGKRPQETEGVDYYFTPEKDFDDLHEKGEFIESVVYCGNKYAISRSEIESIENSGRIALLSAEPIGIIQIRENFRGSLTCCLLDTPSRDLLISRMQTQGRDADSILHRVDNDIEYFQRPEFSNLWDFLVPNTTIEEMGQFILSRLGVSVL